MENKNLSDQPASEWKRISEELKIRNQELEQSLLKAQDHISKLEKENGNVWLDKSRVERMNATLLNIIENLSLGINS